VGLFDGGSGAFIQNLSISLADSTILSPTRSDTCVPPPTNLCYTTTSYSRIVTLPDNPDGYYLSWGRCCRNGTIRNIFRPDRSGMVLSAYIPSTDLCNSSPSFRNALPTFICANDNFEFDHSAIDDDGDSLVYSLTVPFTAGSQTDPFPPPSAPPYAPVQWAQGYGVSNFMDGNPALTVNPSTGLMRVRPRQPGQYVFSLSVFEYRNGVLLSEVKRDIQVNVIECPINVPPDIIRPVGDLVDGDTLLFRQGEQTCQTFLIEDINGIGVRADIVTVTAEGDVLNAPFNGVFTSRPDSTDITGTLCWTPPCGVAAPPDNLLILRAVDQNSCPGPNVTLDTLYVKVLPPDPSPPEIICARFTAPGELTVNWEPLAQVNQEGFTSYRLYRLIGSEYTEVAEITDPDQSSFTETGLSMAPGNTYCYQMRTEKICPTLVLGRPSDDLCINTSDGANLCQVSVDSVAGGITLNWDLYLSDGFQSYRLYRQDDPNGPIRLLTEITDPMVGDYLDTGADFNAQSYGYQLGVLDACGEEQLTPIHQSIFLQLNAEDFTFFNSWTPYRGWNGGVSQYELWVRSEVTDWELVTNLPGTRQEFADNTRADQGGLYCYRVRATPENDDCGFESWSNEVCGSLDPLLFIPNAFTPNADGINDRFTVRGNFVRDFTLQVFNRWGQLIFTSESVENGWDGRVNGRPAPEGVYVYRLQIRGFEDQFFERGGTITLYR
ncbi:MAG: gliding motility-associated C-terminal domain-containing protein, partial [Bacteroidota bacterium]